MSKAVRFLIVGIFFAGLAASQDAFAEDLSKDSPSATFNAGVGEQKDDVCEACAWIVEELYAPCVEGWEKDYKIAVECNKRYRHVLQACVNLGCIDISDGGEFF